MFLKKDDVMLNITEVDPQSYHPYLEQWSSQIGKEFQKYHMDYADNGNEMIRRGEKYVGEVPRVAWEEFKKKFHEELLPLV